MPSGCGDFRAHHMRPEKCRNCFLDSSLHSKPSSDSRATLRTTSAKVGTPMMDNLAKEPQATASELGHSVDIIGEVAKMSKEELATELMIHKEENNSLAKLDKQRVLEMNNLKEQLEKLSNPGNDQSNCLNCAKYVEEIRKLKQEIERLKLVECERDEAREELRSLEREMDEMHDNFKEEESEQFEQLKQDLDIAMKNCKILQIRLNKCERQNNQLEQVKLMLESQLDEFQNGAGTKQMKSQDNQTSRSLTTKSTASFIQLPNDYVKLPTAEYDQLLRDLSDVTEREKDLQEQIKFSQEEAQQKSDKLQAVECENEVLLGKINKLTLANARLRSSFTSINRTGHSNDTDKDSANVDDTSELIQQNEQLKLALEIAQSECSRLNTCMEEIRGQIETKELLLKELTSSKHKLEEDVKRLTKSEGSDKTTTSNQQLELECRQLRTRLVHSDRDCKQLRAQLEMLTSSPASNVARGTVSMTVQGQGAKSSDQDDELARLVQHNKQLDEQISILRSQNNDLERRLKNLISIDKKCSQTEMEPDLLERLKRQLDTSESELAKARSRLVEMDVESNRVQRQYRRLLTSLDVNSSETALGRRLKLPPESQRELMSRQELRKLLQSIELELDEHVKLVKVKECLMDELKTSKQQVDSKQRLDNDVNSNNNGPDEQLKSLRRLVDQERLLSDNLKLDVSRLEQSNADLETRVKMLERERVSMEEELDKLRQVKNEMHIELDETQKNLRLTINRLKDTQINLDRIKSEFSQQLEVARNSNPTSKRQDQNDHSNGDNNNGGGSPSLNENLLLMSRDLSELKVKNGFLMRQLEIANEDSARQIEELKHTYEIQQRRAIELANIEMKERHLNESQQLKDELNELKQKLVSNQRLVIKANEELLSEQDKLKSIERDWRKEKSHWQKRLEQEEAERTIERKSNEFKIKEIESTIREKEREILNVKNLNVQQERELKRIHNKYNLLDEDSKGKLKDLTRELESKKKELGQLLETTKSREDEYQNNCNRFNAERATLLEAIESIKKSYDDKLNELKSTRQVMLVRQEQAYKERLNFQEQIDQLTNQIISLSDNESQIKLLRHQFDHLDKQFESVKRENLQLKDERTKLRTRLNDLEQKCTEYEKRELMEKTSSISNSKSILSSTSSYRSPFHLSKTNSKKTNQPTSSETSTNKIIDQNGDGIIDKLSSKINDQRHLINLLKQQLDETQMELKQVKLLQAAERNKWQTRVTILNSRLNELDEKLIFESSIIDDKSELYESSRVKLEVKWGNERRAILNMLQQSQSQVEALARDLKKLSQTHDLLRLHTKQLETNNNKLSKRLIEYQQLSSLLVTTSKGRDMTEQIDSINSRVKQLERENQRLFKSNMILVESMKNEAQPLVEIVSKILSALDEPPSNCKVSNVTSDSNYGSQVASPTEMSNSTSVIIDRHDSAAKSTQRPLRTMQNSNDYSVKTSLTSTRRLSIDGDGELSDDSDFVSVRSARPAHLVASSQESRLSRLLSMGKSSGGSSTKDQETGAGSSGKVNVNKSVKRVRVKCASLGITTTEKKRLKSHLHELSAMLSNIGDSARTSKSSHASILSPNSRQRLDHSTGESESMGSRVRWQMDSDIESSSSIQQRIQSIGRSSSEQPTSRMAVDSQTSGSSADLYRRFPQTTPSTYTTGASLTDYESESSLASDFTSAFTGRGRLATGAESDSCLTQLDSSLYKSDKLAKSARKKGFKSRLSNTLRTLSRSITGLASDSENETSQPKSSMNEPERNSKGSLDDRSNRRCISEIRV